MINLEYKLNQIGGDNIPFDSDQVLKKMDEDFDNGWIILNNFPNGDETKTIWIGGNGYNTSFINPSPFKFHMSYNTEQYKQAIPIIIKHLEKIDMPKIALKIRKNVRDKETQNSKQVAFTFDESVENIKIKEFLENLGNDLNKKYIETDKRPFIDFLDEIPNQTVDDPKRYHWDSRKFDRIVPGSYGRFGYRNEEVIFFEEEDLIEECFQQNKQLIKQGKRHIFGPEYFNIDFPREFWHNPGKVEDPYENLELIITPINKIIKIIKRCNN